MWPRKLTENFRLKYPIIQAPMAGGATTPELIAAVSNSGGLGSLGAGYIKPEEIKQAIKKIRELTNKPFSVNLFIPEKYQVTPEQIKRACHDINQCCTDLNLEITEVVEPYAPSFDEQIQVLIEEKIPIFSYTFGMLNHKLISRFKNNGTLLVGTATTLAEATMLEESGIDAIVAQGSEAGGHRGSFLKKAEDSLIQLSSLLEKLTSTIKIPIIAAGGIMNGAGIASAIAAGASGAQMGTAFLSCFESGISPSYKQVLLAQRGDKTVLTRAFSGKLARGIRNKFIKCMDKKKQNFLNYPVQNAATNVMRKKAIEKNNTDFMSMWAGQSVALCRNISASEFMKALIIEAEAL